MDYIEQETPFETMQIPSEPDEDELRAAEILQVAETPLMLDAEKLPDSDKVESAPISTDKTDALVNLPSEIETRTSSFLNAVGGGVTDIADDFLNLGENINSAVTGLLGMDYQEYKYKYGEKIFPRSDDFVSNMTRDMVSFSGEFYIAMQTLGLTKFATAAPLIKATVSGFIADFINVDPKEELLQDFLAKQSIYANDILYFLTSDEDSNDLIKRLKSAAFLGGIGLGTVGAIDVLMKPFSKMMRFYKGRRQMSKELLVKSETEVAETAVKKVAKSDVPIKKKVAKSDVLIKEEIKSATRRKAEAVVVPPMVVSDANKVIGRYNTTLSGNLSKMNVKNWSTKESVRKWVPAMESLDEQTYKTLPKTHKQPTYDLNDLMQYEKGGPVNTYTAKQAQMLAAGSADDLDTAFRLLADGRMGEDEFLSQMALSQQIFRQTRKMGSEAGSTLYAHQATITPIHTDMIRRQEHIQNIRHLFGAEGLLKLAKEYIKGSVPTQWQIMKSFGGKVADWMLSARSNYMLSGPIAHGRNIISTGGNLVLNTSEQLAAGGVNSLTGAKVGVKFSEALAYTHGEITGFFEAATIVSKNMYNTAKGNFDGVVPIFADTFDKFADIKTMRVFKDIPFSKLSLMQKGLVAVDYIAAGRIVGDILRGVDNIFKLAAYRGSLAQQAIDSGAKSGLKDKALALHIIDVKLNPNDVIRKRAIDHARKLTFTKPTEGIYQALEGVTRGNVNPKKVAESPINRVGKLFFPFVRTNLNVIETRLERIPVLGLFTKDLRNMRKQGRWAEVIAKQTMGIGLLGGGAYVLKSSGIVTDWYGSLPRNRELQKLSKSVGVRENSVTFGNFNLNLKIGDPVLNLIGVASDIGTFYQIMSDSYTDNDYEAMEAVEAFTNISVSIALKSFNPDFIMSVFTGLHEAAISGNTNSLKYHLSTIPATFSPYNAGVRQYRKYTDDYAKSTLPLAGFAGAYEMVVNEFMRIWAPDGLPPRRDILGKPEAHQTVLMNTSNDPILLEMARLSEATSLTYYAPKKYTPLIVNKPEAKLLTQKGLPARRLTLNEYDELQKWSTGTHEDWKKTTNGAPTLRQVLKKVMNTSSYKEGTDFFKTGQIKTVFLEMHTIGRELFKTKGNIPQELINSVYLKLDLLGEKYDRNESYIPDLRGPL